jgi:hypothetical protein
MRRRVFNALTLMSRLLCVTAAALWYRTSLFSDRWAWYATTPPGNSREHSRQMDSPRLQS